MRSIVVATPTMKTFAPGPLDTMIASLVLISLFVAAPAVAQGDAAGEMLVAVRRDVDRGDYQRAIAGYRRIAQEHPRSEAAIESQLELATLLAQLGRTAEALDTLGSAQSAGSPRQRTRSALLYGELAAADAASLADLEQILARYERPLGAARGELDESFHALNLAAATIELSLDRPGPAGSRFLDVIEGGAPQDLEARAWLGLGEAHFSRGSWVDASEAFQNAVERAPSDAEVGAEAQRRLAYLHRHFLRPSIGQPIWQTTKAIPLSGTPRRPRALVTNRTDDSFSILDTGNDELLTYDAEGQLLERTAAADATSLGRQRDGDPFATMPTGVRLLTTGAVLPFRDAERKEIKRVSSVAHGRFGEWYVATRGRSEVLRARTSGVVEASLTGGAREVTDLDVGPSGEIAVLDGREREVRVFGTEGRILRRISGPWQKAVAVSVDGHGRVYVLDAGHSQVSVHDAQGEVIARVGPTLPGGRQTEDLLDLGIDASGRLLLLTERDGVLVLE